MSVALSVFRCSGPRHDGKETTRRGAAQESRAPAKLPQTWSMIDLLRRDGGTAMRHRIEAAQGQIMGRFTVDFGPPAIPPVIALITAFQALLSALFAPVRLSRVTQSKALISFDLFSQNDRFWGAKIKIPPVIRQ